MLGCTMSSQPELSDIFLSFSYCLLQKRRWCFTLPPSDLPVISRATLLAWAPLWPCTESYMCWLIPCVSDDVSHCQGWLIWAGWKKAFPGNRHIPQTALECFYRRPRDLQRQVWLRLFSFLFLWAVNKYLLLFPAFYISSASVSVHRRSR